MEGEGKCPGGLCPGGFCSGPMYKCISFLLQYPSKGMSTWNNSVVFKTH